MYSRSQIVNSQKTVTISFPDVGHFSPPAEHVFRVMKFTVSTFPWSLVCTNESIFRRRSENDSETHFSFELRLNCVKLFSEVVT